MVVVDKDCTYSGRDGYGGIFFFVKQKTAYEMRISDWSSDVCSSDLGDGIVPVADWIARTISGFASIPPVASSSAIISFHFSRFAPIRRTHSARRAARVK